MQKKKRTFFSAHCDVLIANSTIPALQNNRSVKGTDVSMVSQCLIL